MLVQNMNRAQLVTRVRQHTRDLSNSIFREIDIVDFINEGIERIKQVIPQLKDMPLLLSNTAMMSYLPVQYQHLVAIYATSRCYSQDERHYQATNFMNEFEVKLEELKQLIEIGEIKIYDADGNEVDMSMENMTDYVRLAPYRSSHQRDWED